MKKLLLTSALIASSLLSFAQTPALPNGDFENWSTGSCGEEPSQYVTFDDIYYNKSGRCLASSGVTKSVNKYAGSFALQLSAAVYNTTSGAVTIGNSAVTALSASSINAGIPFTGLPTKLVGYTKFTKGGSDTLGITVSILDNNGNVIRLGELSITSSQNSYTRFEITLFYDPANANPPTDLIVFFGLGNTNHSASASSVALIDAFSFVYPTTTGTINYTSTSPINVYAANKNINFSDDVSDVHVVDMVGAQKIQETATTKTLNAASLTTGLYIVTYKYNDAYFSKKVVIE